MQVNGGRLRLGATRVGVADGSTVVVGITVSVGIRVSVARPGRGSPFPLSVVARIMISTTTIPTATTPPMTINA
jgi:hypothetical protein